MKRKFTPVITYFFAFATFVQAQQIQNGNFENWLGNSLHPSGWSTVESSIGFPFGIVTLHTEGFAAIKLRSDTVQTPYGKFSPAGKACYVSIIYDTTGGIPSLSFYGSPFNARPDSFKFSYKYVPQQNDSASIVCFLKVPAKK